MYRSYHRDGLSVMPDDLWAFAWSAPMRDLAKQIGMSDVGLRKLLRSHGITTPPQGHWNKVHAGRSVPERPKAPDRRPGERGRIWLDEKFAEALPAAPPIPVDGPIASRLVPEDLAELRPIELKALGKVGVPPNLRSPPTGLAELLRKEDKRREKFFASQYGWDKPKLDNPFDQRRLRLLNGLFRALAKRGHTGSVYEHDDVLHISATIGDTSVTIILDAVGKRKNTSSSGYRTEPSVLPASTPMFLSVDSSYRHEPRETWQDDESGKLESRLADITAGVIVAGEAAFRRGLREEQERLEEMRRLEEKWQQEKLAALEKERLEQLKHSGDLLREAEEIRRLVQRVKEAVIAGEREIPNEDLIAWEAWAIGYADRIDPIKSGQFLSHLTPPALPED